jgi:hypothetical protein
VTAQSGTEAMLGRTIGVGCVEERDAIVQPGIREEVLVDATVLACLIRALTCADAEGGYAMAVELQAIAIEQRWCRSCPSGNLPAASPISWLGGPVRSAGGGWCELGKTCVCGDLHLTSSTGRRGPDTSADLRRSRRRFGLR